MNSSPFIKYAVASVIILATHFISPQPQLLQITPEGKKQTDVNLPEKVQSGPAVQTIAGNQLTPGSVPRDFAVNQEIYNDLYRLEAAMNEVMAMILDIGIKPSIRNELLIKMSNLITLIENLGTRYNLRSTAALSLQQIRDIRDDIQKGPREPEAATVLSPYMLLKARLEVVLAELTNEIYTKLVK